jgi:CDP-diacylglycerol--glycerol-3-phosphate 3-phosphatidyltransferase
MSISRPLLTPNQITVIRLILVIPFFFLWFMIDLEWVRSLIVFVFVLIFVFDSVDGYIAQKYNMKTTIGGFLDPVVDHVSILAFLLMLAHIDMLPIWVAFIIAFRDTLVTFLRQLAQLKGINLFPSNFGKTKAELCYFLFPTLYFLHYTDSIGIYVFSLVGLAIFMVYLFPTLFSYDWEYKKLMFYAWGFILSYVFLYMLFQYPTLNLFEHVRIAFVLVMLFFYLGSGVQYFYKNWDVLKG